MTPQSYWPGLINWQGSQGGPVVSYGAAQLLDVSWQFAQNTTMPDHVIIDAFELAKTFHNRVKHLPASTMALFDNTEILNSVLQSLAYDKDAEVSLEYDIMEMVRQCVGGIWDEHLDALAAGMIEFGYGLLSWLRVNGLYVNGYLPYQYGRWLGFDIIVQRLVPPDLNECTPISEAHRHWMFGGAHPLEQVVEQPLPAGIERVTDGVYADLTENPDKRFQ